MARTLEDQIGSELAKEQGGRLGFVVIYRPYANRFEERIIHKGFVETFLLNPENQQGVWVIEVPSPEGTDLTAVRWNEAASEWERLGKVKFGTL